MHVLVVYESLLGNTRVIAEAVAEGIRQAAPGTVVHCLGIGRLAAEQPDADLIVLGGPTTLFGLPRARTRRIWVERALRDGKRGQPHVRLEPGAPGPGIREWLAELPGDVSGVRAATFVTRSVHPCPGSSARWIARRLHRHGCELIAPPAEFFLEGVRGPLLEGERERAIRWGATLIASSRGGCPGVGPG